MSGGGKAQHEFPNWWQDAAITGTLGACRYMAALIFLLVHFLPGYRATAEILSNVREPRIVNIYNFIRNSDFRLANSEKILFDCTRHEIELVKSAKLPATWALQYDALINQQYQALLKEQLGTNDEIGAWWEIPRPLAEKAGLKWRGRHEWDPAANVGFSPGYAPDERRKLVDVYMADFKAIFGYYPRTVGSWYIDEVTLAYMAERYGIVASCNCKDQIGTDFYTLWGGYWNQAYYPSRVNAYMPAQTRRGQVNVPIFRMLGSDPIYQHGTTPGLQSLEPVYREAGGSERWVGWFLNNLIEQPSLAFAYTQAGQENSFGWAAMKTGLTHQVELYAELGKTGKIRVETLAETGEWFRKHYRLTPPTSVVALSDWKNEGRKTVWYDSRFYRVNFLWEKNHLFIRDLHCFDESLVSPTYESALNATSLVYETLPIMDWASWSKAAREPVGVWPVMVSANGTEAPMNLTASPIVTEASAKELRIEHSIAGGGTIAIVCAENEITLAGLERPGKPLAWALKLSGGEKLKSAVRDVRPHVIDFEHGGTQYELLLPRGSAMCKESSPGEIDIIPDHSGKVVLEFIVPKPTHMN
jgi:hypothetical protein